MWRPRITLCDVAPEDNVTISPQLCLPEEIGHVCVGTIDGTKPRQQSHECDSNHANTTDELLDGEDA